MSKEIKRLQGPEWYAKKDSLLMTAYKINEKGHVKGQYIDMDGNLYSHWFSNKEIEELKEQPEEDTVTAYKEAIHHMGVDFGKGLDHTNISLNIPRLSDLDIEKNIDNVLSREELIKQMNDFVLEDEKERYVRRLLNRLHKVKEIKKYINEKIQKSFNYDWGLGGSSEDRLFNETVVELQLIVEKLDEILYGKKEFLTDLENNILNGTGETPTGLMQEFEKSKGDTNE